MEVLQGLMSQVIKDRLFNQVHCKQIEAPQEQQQQQPQQQDPPAAAPVAAPIVQPPQAWVCVDLQCRWLKARIMRMPERIGLQFLFCPMFFLPLIFCCVAVK